MNTTRPLIAFTLGLTIVAWGQSVARAEGEPTSAEEKVLKDKDLKQHDRKFLLDEAAAIEKYEKAKSLYSDFQKAFNRYAMIVQYDDTYQGMVMEQQAMQQQANMLSQQIRSMSTGNGRMQRMVNMQIAPLRQQQSQAQSMANQMNGQVNAMKGQAPKADDRKTVPAKFDQARKEYVDCVGELSELVAPLLTKYHELALDKTVTDTLDKMRKRTALNYKLGPSDELVAASKMVQNVKKHTAGPSKSSKKKAKVKTKAQTETQ